MNVSSSSARTLVAGVVCIAILLIAGVAMPKWLSFLITMSAANGLVSLGIVSLMRTGVVSFGQGMVFALGGYTAALSFGHLGITDAVLLAVSGGLVALLVALPFALLIARYRGIFFAMLSLALSMVLYGVLMKSQALGGSDGFNMGRVTLFGIRPADSWSGYASYAVTVTLGGLVGMAMRIYFDSTRGLVALASRDNEIQIGRAHV